MAKEPSGEYGEQEVRRRAEAALRPAVSTPHKTYEESKLGKRKQPNKTLASRKV